MKRYTLAIPGLLLILLLAGCSSRSDYYRLHPRLLLAQEVRPLHTRHIVGIGEVQVADYLQKESLATRLGPGRIKINDTALWAGSLSKNIQRVLQVNLSRLLPTRTFLSYPWEEPLSDDERLFLTVDRFDGDLNGTVTFMGHWSLIDRKEDRLVTGESFRYIRRGAPGTAGIVETQSRLLEQLSRRIASRIRHRI